MVRLPLRQILGFLSLHTQWNMDEKLQDKNLKADILLAQAHSTQKQCLS